MHAHCVAEDMYWWVYPKTRKQISLLKIPKHIEEQEGIRDGTLLTIVVTDMDGGEYYRGPVTVTSGCEIYLPKNVRRMLRQLKEFRITLA